MALITYEKNPGHGFDQATVSYGGGLTFDVDAAFAGGSTFSISDVTPGLAEALDAFIGIRRVGATAPDDTVDPDLIPPSFITRALRVGRGAAAGEKVLRVQRDGEAHPRFAVTDTGALLAGGGSIAPGPLTLGGGGGSAATWETLRSEFGKTGGIKFNVAIPVPNDPTGFEYKDAYSDAYWDFSYWTGEIDYAVSAVHVNGLKIAGDGLWPDVTKIDRVMQIADYARDRGLYVHLEASALENGGTQAAHLAAVTALGQAFRAARDAGNPHKLIGVDLNNEIANAFGGWHTLKPSAGATAFMTAQATAWKDAYGYTDIPVSWSLFGQDIAMLQDTASDGWIATMKAICDGLGLPFYMDWHPYAASAPFTVAQYASVSALWPTIPIFFGEASVYAGLENQEWEAVYGYIGDVTAASTSFLGVAVYRLDVLEPARDVATAQRRTEILRAVKLIPRIDGGNYGSSSRPIAGGAVTGALAVLAGAHVPRLAEGDASLYPGKVPGWRLVGDVEDVEGGDIIRVQARDAAGAIYGSGSRKADVTIAADGAAGTPVIVDLSSHSRLFVPRGGPTVTTGGGGKIGEAYVFSGANNLATAQIPLAAHFHGGAWIKPTGPGPGANFIMGQWANGAAVGGAIVALFWDSTNGSIYVWFVDSTGAFKSTNSSPGTVPVNQWTHVAYGVEAGGFILVGTATGAAANVHLEDPGFPGGAPHAGDGVVKYTIGDMDSQDAGFAGLIDSPFLYNGAMPSADYAVPADAHGGYSLADPLLMFALPLDTQEASGGAGSGHFATPILPYPAALDTVDVWGSRSGASATLTNLQLETVYR